MTFDFKKFSLVFTFLLSLVAAPTFAVTSADSVNLTKASKLSKKSLDTLTKARLETQLRRLKNTLSLQLTSQDDYRRLLQKIRLEVEK